METDARGVAFEYANGKLYSLTDPYGQKESVVMPRPSLKGLAEVIQQLPFRRGLGRITLVRLDCSHENLTDQELAWHLISPTTLAEQLGVPVRQVSDIKALARGLSDPLRGVPLPTGILLLNNHQEGETGGAVRKYVVHDGTHWEELGFGDEAAKFEFVSDGAQLLSHDEPTVQATIQRFIAHHPDIQRLVVWSPDGLPIQARRYNELQPHGNACEVTILGNSSFALSNALLLAD